MSIHTFFKDVDKRSRSKMTAFLKDHFRYPTANSWNLSTSYANNIKIYNLGLPKETEDKLWELLDCNEVYDRIRDLISDFGMNHNWIWQAGINGRSGGYLVLYTGGEKPSGYKSYCTACGQRNFKTVEETGNNICGRCKQPARINYTKQPTQIYTYPGKSVDQEDDFENWTMEELRERVTLVQEFDRLADDIIAEAVYLAENFEIEDKTYYVQKTRKVLVEKGMSA